MGLHNLFLLKVLELDYSNIIVILMYTSFIRHYGQCLCTYMNTNLIGMFCKCANIGINLHCSEATTLDMALVMQLTMM